jgi:hypothetical protein
LYCGLIYNENVGEVNLSLAHNVKSHDLKKLSSTDRPLRLKAVALLDSNKKLEVTVPKNLKEGDLTTKFYTNITTLAELERIALNDIKSMQSNGIEGSLNTYLMPRVRHGELVNLSDPLYQVLDGSYVVGEVITTLNENGTNRKITLKFSA